MAFKKMQKYKRNKRNYREFKDESFVKIIRSRHSQMHFNVWASRMFGLNIKRVDVLIDEDENEILICQNDKSGEYSFVAPKGVDARFISCDSILTNNPDIDTNRRYLVVKCDEGMKFKFERIPDFYRCKGGES